MLSVWLGEIPFRYIDNTTEIFDKTYDDEWVHSKIAELMVKGSDDKSIPGIIQSWQRSKHVDNKVKPTKAEMNRGYKKVLVIAFDKERSIFAIHKSDDYCIPFIEKIAKDKEVSIKIDYIPSFSEDQYDLGIRILNDYSIVHSRKELIQSSVYWNNLKY